jgi:tetratricopeptide (TPR) repeat protein
MTADDARALFAQARERHAARDVAGSIELTRQALTLDPDYPEALEHLATLLVTRRHAYTEGLDAIERAVAARPHDAGLWYALGWLYEFAAHELARRGGADAAGLDPRALYERAAEAFRRCLALNPDGKLQGDAEDLLDHVENELMSRGW